MSNFKTTVKLINIIAFYSKYPVRIKIPINGNCVKQAAH
jgi:hypothetical protein